MKILVTRPSPAGEQLVNSLRTHGKDAWHFPLIKFLPGKDLPHLLQRLAELISGDLLFIISQHAIDYAHSYLKQQGATWPPELCYYTIGRSTGLHLHELSGLPVNYSDKGNTSEDLLRLPALADINGKRAHILRGNGGRKILEQTLRQRGVHTTYCECYRRSPIHYNSEEQSQHLKSLDIDTLVITSGEMLQQFYTLMPDDYRHACLTQCRLIVVSKRLAMFASHLGWLDIVVANAADNDALMNVLL
ncbi:MAG: uroporphyrinogen-III synthase [Sodalis sp. (in: enterobacteria)]